MHDLDRIAVRLGQPDAPAAAGFIDVLDTRGAGEFGDRLQIVLAGGGPGKTDEAGIAFFGDVDVVHGIGAAHVKRRRRACRAHHPERGQKRFLGIQIGRPEPAISEVPHLDNRHDLFSLDRITPKLSPVRPRNKPAETAP